MMMYVHHPAIWKMQVSSGRLSPAKTQDTSKKIAKATRVLK
jgi:hypothetical protein